MARFTWQPAEAGCNLARIVDGPKKPKCGGAKPEKGPKGAKIRKQAMRRREAKFEKYNRPKGERRRQEPKEKAREREDKLEKFSRPKSQRKKDG